MKNFIDGAAYKAMVIYANAVLHENIQPINDLNVFPVPDGDTGTNMGLTINNAAVELEKAEFPTVSAAADCVKNAMLRGARGNSGVILSLLFRGIAKGLKGAETADAAKFAAAMQTGVEAAYKAVMKPAEGTILTVSRLAADAAVKAAEQGLELEAVLEAAIAEGEKTLAETVHMNPVLEKAGVIDAGGKGYMLILSCMLESLRGAVYVPSGEAAPVEEAPVEEEQGAECEEQSFTYAVKFAVLRAGEKDPAGLKGYLEGIGGKLEFEQSDAVLQVSLCTNDPGKALTNALKYGGLVNVSVENLKQSLPEEAEEPEIAAPEKEFGVVSVCAGDGMEGLFRELGADGVVTGGQTMNPSTEDILKEVNRTPASTVFVFPNNKNIIMAAQQCGRLTEKKVVVVETTTVPQGISALLNYDSSLPEEELVETMKEAASHVHTAMVTYAARDSEFDGYTIHAGEYLALMDGKLIGSYAENDALLAALGEAVKGFEPEFVTVYYGSDVDEASAQALGDALGESASDAEVSVIYGGQPVYYYMISVE